MKQAVLNISPINKLNLNSQGLKSLPFGALGPDLKDSLLNGANSWQKNFLRIVDHTAAELHYFVCGANQVNMHRMNMTWNTLGGVKESVDIRKAKAGDSCLHDPTQKLEECRGIEVGHIFQLGRKYSQALQANFTNESGSQENLWMGCYGIGISRLAQAAVEQSHDEGGICWPVAIAPFEVIVVIANIKDPIQKQLGEKLYDQLLSKGIDVLLDDRAERAGVKFKDADLIGIPWRVVAGRDSASEKVEVVERSCRETTLMTRESAIEKLLNVILGNHS